MFLFLGVFSNFWLKTGHCGSDSIVCHVLQSLAVYSGKQFLCLDLHFGLHPLWMQNPVLTAAYGCF